MGYSSVYENYNLIEIKNGVNIKSKKNDWKRISEI
jgi:hypothetical protein